MGLDMYLTAERYLGSYTNTTKRDIALEGLEGDHPPVTDNPSMAITLDVAYWRKANQVHDWFVERVQGGEDNCQKYFVPLDDLRELVTTARDCWSRRARLTQRRNCPRRAAFSSVTRTTATTTGQTLRIQWRSYVPCWTGSTMIRSADWTGTYTIEQAGEGKP